jgi:hypothetical protein
MTAREIFLRHVRTPEADTTVQSLRAELVLRKRDAIEGVGRVPQPDATNWMSELYESVIHLEVQLSGHVGLGVALALALVDEHKRDASLSFFGRELRDAMSATSEEMVARHGSRLTKMVAQIEAQRLVWRHCHEFMSWLAFRRDDERYPASDRLERLTGFGVQQRLLDARAKVLELLGVRLCSAIESCDRFMLANRWRLSDSPEHALERYVWSLLSYQPASTVKLEVARLEFDCLAESGASAEVLDGERERLAGMLEVQLSSVLADLPEPALAGAL